MRSTSKHFERSNARRGSLLIEALVAAIILGVAMSMLVPGLSAVRHQRQTQRFEALTMVELNNIAEFLALSADSDASPVLSKWFQERYSTARLETERLPVAPDGAATGLQAVRLTIRRPSLPSMPDQQVSVVVWQSIPEPTP